MSSIFQRYRQIILLALLLIYTLAQIFSAREVKRHQLNFLERFIIVITAPPQQFFTFLLDKTNDLRLGYAYLVDTRKNYQQLLHEHRALVLKASELEEERLENIRLRTMLGFKEKTRLKMLPAKVISLGTSTFTHSLRIDKGKSDGVHERMSVITPDGVVGHIVSTTNHYANVLMLLDPNSNIDVADQATRTRGLVQGQSTSTLRMDYVARTENVELGDLLISSGFDGIYPKGLHVGIVGQKHQDPSNIFLEVAVKPAVNFARLEEVLVVTTLPPPDEVIDETPISSEIGKEPTPAVAPKQP